MQNYMHTTIPHGFCQQDLVAYEGGDCNRSLSGLDLLLTLDMARRASSRSLEGRLPLWPAAHFAIVRLMLALVAAGIEG